MELHCRQRFSFRALGAQGSEMRERKGQSLGAVWSHCAHWVLCGPTVHTGCFVVPLSTMGALWSYSLQWVLCGPTVHTGCSVVPLCTLASLASVGGYTHILSWSSGVLSGISQLNRLAGPLPPL